MNKKSGDRINNKLENVRIKGNYTGGDTINSNSSSKDRTWRGPVFAAVITGLFLLIGIYLTHFLKSKSPVEQPPVIEETNRTQ